MNGLRKYGTYNAMEFYSVIHKTEILSFAGRWMELENIILSKVRLRRTKITCSPSYVDYRPKTNAVILLNKGHTLRGDCTGGIGQGKEIKTLKVVDVLTV
jgi:hypothetical protein